MSIEVVTKLPAELKKLNLDYRQSVLESIADYLDLVRMLAIKKYIIPDRFKGKGKRYKYRNQPTDPKRLTSRTGALLKMLGLGIDKWTRTAGGRKSASAAIQGNVKTERPGTLSEQYEGKLTYSIKEPYSISKVSSGQQLAVRFMWDNPGLRGKKRPFLSAANEELITQSAMERLAKKRLSKLGLM